MKFLKEEHEAIVRFFEKKGVQSGEYRFIKKKGWLIIIFPNRDANFSFRRKTETKLNSNLQFEEKTTYYVNHEKDKPVSCWEDVITELELWLKNK